MGKKAIQSILEDEREIRSAFETGDDGGWMVGVGGITKIEAYPEVGQAAYVPWLAVYAGEAIQVRLNCARLAGIVYKLEGAKEE